MLKMIFKLLLLYYKWLCLLFSAWSLILGLIALFAVIVNLIKLIFRQDSQFRFYHFAKVLLAGGVAYLYYFIYGYKDFGNYFLKLELPVATIALIVLLCLPIGLVQAADMIFLEGSKPAKKK